MSISSKAANELKWTQKEIACAFMYKKFIIPVRLDNSPFCDSAILQDRNSINYYLNPDNGLNKLICNMKVYLEEDKADIPQRERLKWK